MVERRNSNEFREKERRTDGGELKEPVFLCRPSNICKQVTKVRVDSLVEGGMEPRACALERDIVRMSEPEEPWKHH